MIQVNTSRAGQGRLTVTAAMIVSLVGVAGCGSDSKNPTTAPVIGDVTLDGQPVDTGQIIFYPEQGRPGMGSIAEGRYSLRTFEDGDGALRGSHVVTITAMQVKRRKSPKFQPPSDATSGQIEDLRMEMEREAVAATTWLVPEQYSKRTTTPLRADVKDERNEINFTLTTKPPR